MQDDSSTPVERRGYRVPARTSRGTTPGRRRTDHDPRATISRKLIVVTVFVIDALYLVGEALLFGHDLCP